MEELKAYYVVDTTKDWTRTSLISNAFFATNLLFSQSFPLKEPYLNQSSGTPKITKRVKKASHWNRVIQDLGDSNIVFVEYEGIIAIQPIEFASLPYFIQKLQLAEFSTSTTQNQTFGTNNFIVLERRNSDLPAGKLVAQVGHIVTRLLKQNPNVDLFSTKTSVVTLTFENLNELDNFYNKYKTSYSSYIIDSGRTHYKEPTPTVAGIGFFTDNEILAIKNKYNV